MSYWSDHPELLDEITIKFLPADWKEEVESGRAWLEDVPEDIRFRAMDEGIADYWGTKADEAKLRFKENFTPPTKPYPKEDDDGIFE
jgi:hypothetical protein